MRPLFGLQWGSLMTLECPCETISRQLQFGGGYDRNAARLLLGRRVASMDWLPSTD